MTTTTWLLLTFSYYTPSFLLFHHYHHHCYRLLRSLLCLLPGLFAVVSFPLGFLFLTFFFLFFSPLLLCFFSVCIINVVVIFFVPLLRPQKRRLLFSVFTFCFIAMVPGTWIDEYMEQMQEVEGWSEFIDQVIRQNAFGWGEGRRPRGGTSGRKEKREREKQGDTLSLPRRWTPLLISCPLLSPCAWYLSNQCWQCLLSLSCVNNLLSILTFPPSLPYEGGSLLPLWLILC